MQVGPSNNSNIAQPPKHRLLKRIVKIVLICATVFLAFLILAGILLIAGAVYVIAAVPNPGHSLTQLEGIECSDNRYLRYDSDNGWSCDRAQDCQAYYWFDWGWDVPPGDCPDGYTSIYENEVGGNGLERDIWFELCEREVCT